MLPVACPSKGVHNKIETAKTEFATVSTENGKSQSARFYPNTIGTYHDDEKRRMKALRRSQKQFRKHAK